MVIQFFCPLRVTCTRARSTMLGRSVATGRVRSTQTIRTTPSTCTSFRTAWTGTTAAIATTDILSAQFASEQNITLYAQRVTRKGHIMA